MTKPFPNNPYLRGNYAPLLMESDAANLEVIGEIPPEICGTLYRNGPNPQFPPLSDYHWFSGDGMIHAFHIEDGQASYRNRWIRTNAFEMEREAGRKLFSSTMEGDGADPSVQGLDSNPANTNVIEHGGKLLALYEVNSPMALDPITLETEGYTDFGGGYSGPVTAHPKIDHETGELLFFAYMATSPGSPDVAYVTVDKDGKVTRSDIFEAPYCSMIHDFMPTTDHVMFPILPATVDIDRIMKGGPLIAWDPTQESRFGIMPRRGSVDEMQWFTGDPCYVYHPMNAWSEGSKVITDVFKYDRVPLFPNADGSEVTERDLMPDAKYVRWTFDLDGGTDAYKEETLLDVSGDFPRFDERFMGQKVRHGFFGAHADGRNRAADFNMIVHFDHDTLEQVNYVAPDGGTLLEPAFVPRNDSAVEGDGYLITIIYRPNENRSDLLVLDCDDISKGPIATVKMPMRIPSTFHGNWVQGSFKK